MKITRTLSAAVVVALLSTGCLEKATRPVHTETAATRSPVPVHISEYGATPAAPAQTPPRAQTTTRPATVVAGPLLVAAGGGDGDSWKDTAGREYRLGLVNTPEYNECYGSQATAKRKELVADGFWAKVYTTDTYGRSVAVITTANGTNLNIWLARHGFANDKYLSTYRAENPTLASRLDVAFAAAKAEHAGLWGACVPDSKPATTTLTRTAAPSRGNCDPSYPTVCIPPPPPDLDCGQISYRRFKVLAPDPHGFDADHDGIGCESG